MEVPPAPSVHNALSNAPATFEFVQGYKIIFPEWRQIDLVKAFTVYTDCSGGLHFQVSAAATRNKAWSKLNTDSYTRFYTSRAKAVLTCTMCECTQHSAATCPMGGCKRDREVSIPFFEEMSVMATRYLCA